MRPFAYETANSTTQAVTVAARGDVDPVSVSFLAGGTTLVDLMKLDVMRPARLVDINPLAADPLASRITRSDKGLRLGALVRMSEAAGDAGVVRDYPVIAQSLALAASSGLRNMASLGGNILQRTRCTYFRDVSFKACNKREPGSGCAALDGVNRSHAVLGTSEDCIATYPGDFAQALIALDAILELQGASGVRALPFAALHTRPGHTPQIETSLRPGELITAIVVPGAAPRRSLYLKVRDRESYEFALASAAVALDLDGRSVKRARIALGGVATVPWRAVEAEAALTGKTIDEESAAQAADAAFASAKTRGQNAYKVPLGRETLVRALLQAAQMEG